jgi:hypothetical protein
MSVFRRQLYIAPRIRCTPIGNAAHALRRGIDRAGTQKNLASLRIAELKLDTTRNPEKPSATVPGTIAKIVPSPSPGRREKAQITIDGPDRRCRNLRIENVR